MYNTNRQQDEIQLVNSHHNFGSLHVVRYCVQDGHDFSVSNQVDEEITCAFSLDVQRSDANCSSLSLLV